MEHVVPTILASFLGLVFTILSLRRFTRAERPYITAGFFAHALGAIGLVVVNYYVYGEGDMLGYMNRARRLAHLLELDFNQYAPQVVGLLFHQRPTIPLNVIGAGHSTGSMAAVAGMAAYVMGATPYGICMLLSVGSFAGKVALYRAFRDALPQDRTRLLVAVFLIPSAVFWSAGLVKEMFAVTGLGLLVLGFRRILYRHLITGLGLTAVGATIVGLFKAYILFGFVVAAGMWYYWHLILRVRGQSKVVVRPMYAIAGAVLAFAGLALLGTLFPAYSVDQFAETAAHLQSFDRGGSAYSIGDPSERSFFGQLAYAPIALLVTLFRPLPIEAHNAQMLASSIQTGVFTVLLVMGLVRRGPRGCWRHISRSPELVFALVFVAVTGTAIGLATTNFGSLSRYRAPFMPCYGLLVLILSKRRRVASVPAGRQQALVAAR